MRLSTNKLVTLPLFLTVAGILALSGCSSSETGTMVDNKKPFIRITGGPPDGQRDSYTARIWWTGWDDDGVVEHYEYALDPPEEFSIEEINTPDEFVKTGSLNLTTIRGPEDKSDTLRYERVDNPELFFEYIQTRDFSRSFAFETPIADSTSDGSSRIPSGRYSGMHTVYVRAQDNDEAYSELSAKLAFTAETITPEAEIVRPNIGSGILQVGSQIQISWDGLDPDSPEPRKKPSDYLFKLVRLDTLDPPIPILTANPDFVMWKATNHIPWTLQSADTTNTSYFLDTPGNYMFSVRAVDVAGAEEPFVEFVRADGDPGNTFLMSALSAGGQPELRVTEPSLGTISATGAGVVEYEVATGQPLFFEWIANAESYGGVVEGYNWGINIPDLDRDGPGSGWRGWSTLTGNFDPVVFENPGTNVVNVKVRDTGGVTTVITVILTVIEFELSRELLVVDDWKDGIWPRDDVHDAFWMETLTNSGRFTAEELIPENIMFHSHGLNDIEFRDPQLPDLEFLGKYRMITYDTSANGYNGRSGLVNTGPIRRHLGSYLRAGGKLWITGESTVAAMLPTVTGQADFAYPKEGIMSGDFPYDFMRLYTSRIENDKNVDNDKNGIIGVRSLPNLPEYLPPMDIDRNKRSPIIRGEGVGSFDAIFDPIFQQDDPLFRTYADSTGYVSQIDSLYVSVTNENRSTYNNKLVATRWSDTSPDRRHGRVMWFGFPVYYMLDEDFQEVFNTAFDWFKEENVFDKPRQNQ